MQAPEFNRVSSELVNAFGVQRWPSTRLAFLWKHVQDLDVRWFERTVEKVVLSMDYSFDWLDAAKAERSARGNVDRANRVTEASSSFGDKTVAEIIAGCLETQKIYQKLLNPKINSGTKEEK